MWTLLAAAEPRDRAADDADAATRARRSRNGAPVEPPAIAASDSDRSQPPASRAMRNGAEPAHSSEVQVYLHPGGAAVGGMDVDQASAQFDLDGAPVFASLDEAVRACRGYSGFLVEVCRPLRDADGREMPRAVFFVERLRA